VTDRPPVYLIDASVYVFRAWFSIPDQMTCPDGHPVNALYGFTRFLGDFLERVEPDHVGVAFDESLTTSFRNEIYPEYKANRESAPDELKRQFAQCREVTRSLGMTEHASDSYEADDIIGTLVYRMRDNGYTSTILSRDKDLAQLLRDGDSLWDFAGDKTVPYEGVPEHYGVRAEQMADFLGLAGDSVDNIPGVRGIGKKTAQVLLAEFEDLEAIYDNLEIVPTLTMRGAASVARKLDEQREDAFISRRLAEIHCEIPLDVSGERLRRQSPDLGALNAFYDRVGFGQALRRQAQRIADCFSTPT
jgi:5'-3' exonuclease